MFSFGEKKEKFLILVGADNSGTEPHNQTPALLLVKLVSEGELKSKDRFY